jgi:hypothetical protein
MLDCVEVLLKAMFSDLRRQTPFLLPQPQGHNRKKAETKKGLLLENRFNKKNGIRNRK